MSSLSRELVFLILQFLDEEKFKESVHKLEQESGFFFNMKYLEEKVQAGEWEEAEKYLSGYTKVDDNRYSMKIFFEIRKQKYLEALDSLNWQHQLCKTPRPNPDIKTLFIDHTCTPPNGARASPVSVPVAAVPKAVGTYTPLGAHGVSYPAPHPQVPWSLDDLPRVVACSLTEGSNVWDLSGQRLYVFEGHEAPVYSICPHRKENIQSRPHLRFNKKGNLLAVATVDNGFKILANADGLAALRAFGNRSFEPFRAQHEAAPIRVTRLLYTNSGVGLLALGSNAIQRLWKWSRNEQNPTGKALFLPREEMERYPARGETSRR
ncbi:hypothetical protein BHE74_00024119, partial [Ensete ventricosum]